MNNEQLVVLAEELAKPAYAAYGQDYPAIAATLNGRPSVSNPTPQGTTPKQLTLSEFFRAAASVDPAGAMTAIGTFAPLMSMVQAAISNNDRTSMQDYLAIFSSILNDGADAALLALFAQTEPDPSWQATIPGDSIATALGLPTVSEMDVQLCVHPELWSGD